jgi:hypothetical protein
MQPVYPTRMAESAVNWNAAYDGRYRGRQKAPRLLPRSLGAERTV